MREQSPPRIGLLSLTLELYQKLIPDTIAQYRRFHERCCETLAKVGRVIDNALCCRREDVDQAVARMEAAGADMLVIVLQSYSPSLVSLPALLRTSLPLLIWNTQSLAEITPELSITEINENHGMHGAQDLCNCLKRARRQFGIVAGHYQDPCHLEDLRGWLDAAHAVSRSRRLKVGMLGEPFHGMGDFGVDETMMAAVWGPSVERLTLNELAEALENVSQDELDDEMARDREKFDFAEDIELEDHRRSARLSMALRRLVEERRLDALTMNFMAFGRDTRIETVPYLGLSHLMAEGLGYAGEGNVTVAALGALLGGTFSRCNFTEMFTPDHRNNRILFYHMAEGNYSMAKAGHRPRLKKVPFFIEPAKPYLTPIYAYEPGPSTFVNVTTDSEGRFYLITFEADVIDFSIHDRLNAPHFLAQVQGRLGQFLDSYGLSGGTHHLCRVEGRRIEQIGRMAHMLEMELKIL
jgi:L-arabinose isomerase